VNGYDLENIDSLLTLNTFVNGNKYLQGVDKATLDAFKTAAVDSANTGLLKDKPFLLGRPEPATVGGESWALHSARFGLGEIKVTITDTTISAQSKHINGTYNATIDTNRKGAKGRWSGTGDDKKQIGGKLVVDINSDSSLTLLLYLDGSKTPESTWTIWYADKPKK